MANTFELIASSTLSSSSASVTFSSIPGTYTDLQIFVSSRDTTTSFGFYLYLNGSTTSYTSKWIEGDGSSVVSYNSPNGLAGYSDASSFTANTFGNTSIYIPNYASSNNKSTSIDSVMENNATSAYMAMGARTWANTSQVTSLVFGASGSFETNTSFYIYGIKNS